MRRRRRRSCFLVACPCYLLQMSRSTFLTTASSPSSFDASETPSLPTTTTTTSDHTHVLRFHHRLMPTISSSSRSNETLPVVLVQSSRMTSELPSNSASAAPSKSVATLNPKVKRNLRGKRRSTGIRADDISLASTMSEVSPARLGMPMGQRVL